MSCSDKIKIDRLKTFTHASVLAMQEAHIRGIKMAVVKKQCKYGEYYEGMVYEEAIEKKEKIYITHTKTGKWKPTPKGVVEVLD